ncbi:hypothetical protein [Sorangium sp. So ce693]|uniref:hypothetical protein n=1 Tax=unclassified Sorangium TaxID=2621164 RepID=UPI003F620730
MDQGDGTYVVTAMRVTDDDLESPAEALARSGDATAGTVISGVSDSADLAFDAAGNLWVATGDAILRYDAGRLAASLRGHRELLLKWFRARSAFAHGATEGFKIKR